MFLDFPYFIYFCKSIEPTQPNDVNDFNEKINISFTFGTKDTE